MAKVHARFFTNADRARRHARLRTARSRALQGEAMSGDDVEVRPEDQRAINSFGRLNNRKHDIEDEIKEKQSFHDLLDDASNEMILADEDEPVRYGPPFSAVPTSDLPARTCRAFLACGAQVRVRRVLL